MWIALDCNIYTNPKTIELADVLGLDIDTTVAKLSRLWSWAMLAGNESGDITHLPPEEVAAIMRWKKKPEMLYCALVSHGFIDVTDNRKIIHDWHELNGKQIIKKRQDRERKG